MPPPGAEPLDDPQVPPSRPPTTDELTVRYTAPWTAVLEPWLAAILRAAPRQHPTAVRGRDAEPPENLGTQLEIRQFGLVGPKLGSCH
jgi:hypothetical protein